MKKNFFVELPVIKKKIFKRYLYRYLRGAKNGLNTGFFEL